MTTPAPATQTKTRGRKASQSADEAAAANPNILCHQIGLCRSLAELQSFIANHNLLNVETDSRFDARMKVVIEEALDTMTEVLQNPDSETAALFPVPADLAAKGWKIERDGVGFLFRRGQLATSQYVVRSEAAEAARKLHARESKHGASSEAAGDVGDVTDRRGPAYWRGQADAMTETIRKKLRPYDAAGKVTLKKIEVYEQRIADGLDWQQWQGTLVNFADALEAGELPTILRGLTNDNQVRRLMTGPVPGAPFSNMGPTVKTFEDLVAAHEALMPLIPARLEDPHPSPREGTEWAQAEPAFVEAGTPEAEKELQALRGLYGHTEPTADEREQKIEERGGQVNEHGVYVEGVETVTIKTTKKLGRVELQVVQDRVDGKWRHGNRYDFGGRAPWFDNGAVVGQPFDTREEALAAAALEVAQVKPELGTHMERFVEALDLPAPAEPVEDTPATEATPVEPRIFCETVEVKLNNDDVAVKARKAAAIEVQIEEIEAEMKRTSDAYKQKIGGLREEHRELMRAINRGHDELELEVYERRDYDNHMVATIRADSGEVVATRAMKPTEYQMPLVSL